MTATVEYLPNKAIPTWVVKQGESRWYFSSKSEPVFDHPGDNAQKMCDKLNIEVQEIK